MAEEQRPLGGGQPSAPQPGRAMSEVGGAGSGLNRSLAMVGLGLCTVLVLYFLNRPDDDAPVTALTPVEEEFGLEGGGRAPELPPVAPPSLPPPVPAPVETAVEEPEDDLFEREELARLRELALQRAQEAMRLRAARWRSQMVVLDGGVVVPRGTSRAVSPGTGEPSSAGERLSQALERARAAAARAQRLATGAASGATGVGGLGALGGVLAGGAGGGASTLGGAAGQGGASVVTAQLIEHPDRTIVQGKLLAGILETAIQSDLPGMVRAILSDDAYSYDGTRLLLPKGSRLVGHYRSQLRRGQARVLVVWNRVVRPDGISVQLQSEGTDPLGRAGLGGEVDTHFLERFGASILLSVIDGAVQAAVQRSTRDLDGGVSLQQNGNALNRAAEIALQDSISIPPTVHVDQGTRIRVFVARDLDFQQVIPLVAHHVDLSPWD